MSQKQKVWTLSEWQEVTNYLIGRGKGLTPSGDDILVAYQTILFILADERAAALAATLRQQIYPQQMLVKAILQARLKDM